MSNFKCPKCGESYYMERYNVSTALYCPPIFKNRVNINPDRNITIVYYSCLNCGHQFNVYTRGGEIYDNEN